MKAPAKAPAAKLLVTLTEEDLRSLVREAVRHEVQTREPEPEVLTFEQAAEILQWSHPTLRKAIEEHGLPARKLPVGGWRLRRSEILAWIDRQPTRAA